MGPKFKMLMIHFFSRASVPDGGGWKDAVAVLRSPDKMKMGMQEARNQTELAIRAVREAVEPNPHKDSTDEEIAYEILKRIPNMCEDCGKTKYKINDQMVCVDCFNARKVK